MTSGEEIRNLMFRYCELMDAGDIDAVADMFADATIVMADGNVATGHDEVLALFAGGNRAERTSGGRRSKHVNTNVWVEADDAAGTATARSYWVLIVSTSPEEPVRPIMGGAYHDEFVARDGTWRFAKRTYLVDLVGDDTKALLGYGE
jgi:3-phenylpropionate/cinnamic acid dioxygenase small subunit